MSQTNILQGTLDLLILKTLALGEMHGLGIARRIEQITQGTFLVKPGSLFPALHRMEEARWLVSFWGDSENNRRAKFYRLTDEGRRQFDAEVETWDRITLAMASALRSAACRCTSACSGGSYGESIPVKLRISPARALA